MSGTCSDNYITPAESDCLAQIECERTTAKQEIENIQHILWLNFQDSAHFTAALCKIRGSTNSSLLQFQFQQSAIAVTRLYKDSVDAVERAFELGQQSGEIAYRRDLSTWSKRKKRKINRLDLLRQLARRNCPILGLASPRSNTSSSLTSQQHNYCEPSGLQSRQISEGQNSRQNRKGQNSRQNREGQNSRQNREGQNSRQQSPSPPSTPPHSSAPSYDVSRKRKSETSQTLLDEFLQTVQSAKRNRQQLSLFPTALSIPFAERSGNLAMPKRSKRSPTAAVEGQNQDPDTLTPVKKEIKTEQEELEGKSIGLICPKCEAHFLRDEYFFEHVKEHHQDMNSETMTSNVSMSSATLSEKLSNPKTTAEQTPGVQCEVCSYTCSFKFHLLQDQRTHTGERHFKCSQCSYACSEKGNLVKHHRTHTRKKSYKCKECSLSFTQKSSLTRHQRIHTGEKPYKCNACSLSFTQKNNLTQHQRIHTGEKPYKCTECSLSFTRKSHLILHQRIHTGEKPYRCKKCKYTCSVQSNLRRHTRTIHPGEKPES